MGKGGYVVLTLLQVNFFIEQKICFAVQVAYLF